MIVSSASTAFISLVGLLFYEEKCFSFKTINAILRAIER